LAKPELFLPFFCLALRSWYHLSLRFDAPALRTLFAITVTVLLMTTIFTVAEQRPDSFTQTPFPEPSKGGSTAFRVSFKG